MINYVVANLKSTKNCDNDIKSLKVNFIELITSLLVDLEKKELSNFIIIVMIYEIVGRIVIVNSYKNVQTVTK